MNRVYVGILCLLFSGILSAQGVNEALRTSAIQPYCLAISDEQTTNLIFPHTVRRVHCASRELEIEQMKDVKNILLVRSVTQGFSPTNLSVVTNDGRFYSFSLQYANEPSVLNLRFEDSSVTGSRAAADVPYNDALIKASADLVTKQKKFIRLSGRNQQVKFSLDGIFMHNNLMWFVMTVKNSSVINYPVDYIKVFVRDRVRSKRTIRQEKEMQPVFVRMEENMIGGSTSRVVLAFEPFTAGTDKMMAIQMAGKYGDRFIELRAASHVFYKTRAIVD